MSTTRETSVLDTAAGKKQKKEAGLSAFLTKQLLQAIEQSGETRDTFNLFFLVTEEEDLYGAEGSENRRKTQQRFDLIKRKKILNYAKYLRQHKVRIGPVTEKLVEEEYKKQEEEENTKMAGKKNKPKADEDDDSFVPPDELSSNESEEEEQEPTFKKAPADSSVSTSSGITLSSRSSSSGRAGGRQQQHHSQTKKASSAKKSPNHSPNPFSKNQHVFGKTSDLHSSFHSAELFGLSGTNTDQDGTRESPWLIFVDTEHPGRNREF